MAEPDRAAFFERVREVTSRVEGTGARILAPLELTYPRGLVQATMLMNYSRIPTFVPDYRHVLWRERYHNRAGLFCFLFPGYPNEDYPFRRRACDEALDPEPELVQILDDRLRTAILPVYRIEFAGGPAKPFSTHLKGASPRYGWPVVTQTDSAAFVRTDPAPMPGVARLAPGEAAPATFAIRVAPDTPGPHVIILGGRRLASRAPRVDLDGRPLGNARRSANWAVFEADLSPGPHVLSLPSLEGGPDPEADYLYFAAVLQREAASRYVLLPPVDPGARR
jgi:hypothetical protein